jgi:glycopeptide antibiotics resistance protein
LLYLPFGFLACGAISRWTSAAAIAATALLGLSLAVSVEFAQIWAVPRTVSLDDIIAECLGTGLGILLWVSSGKWVVRAIRTAFAGGRGTVSAVLVLYLLAYSFIALFPFDFLVTRTELEARMADPNAIVWIPVYDLTPRGLVSVLLKGALMAPLGIAARLVWRRGGFVVVFVAGFLSGILEIVHWYEYSAVTDAISVVMAMLGAAFGYCTADWLRIAVLRGVPWLKKGVWLAVPVYLAALPVLRGWHPGHAGRKQIEDTLASLNWLPFYYHYFTTETNAVASFLGVTGSYAPVGVFLWALRSRPGEPAGQTRSLVYSALAAGVLAAVMEAGGLVTTGLRPDPTNTLIAMVAAMLAQRTCEWAARVGPGLLGSKSMVR